MLCPTRSFVSTPSTKRVRDAVESTEDPGPGDCQDTSEAASQPSACSPLQSMAAHQRPMLTDCLPVSHSSALCSPVSAVGRGGEESGEGLTPRPGSSRDREVRVQLPSFHLDFTSRTSL